MELSCKDAYEQVSQQLAQALQPPLEDPLKLRFTQQNGYSQQPKPNPLRHPGQEEFLLPDMLTQFAAPSDTLFYEVLDLPLPELERLKTLKVRIGFRSALDVERCIVCRVIAYLVLQPLAMHAFEHESDGDFVGAGLVDNRPV